MLCETEWSWELSTWSHKMNLLDILSTSPHYFCRKWIGATNENSNFDAFLYLEWQSNRYYNSFVRHEGFQSSTRDMPAGYQRCWRTWSVDKLAGNRGNKVQGDFYKILFSTAWCIRLKWLVVAVSFFSCIFTLSSLIQNCSINNSQFSLVVGADSWADESEHWSLLSSSSFRLGL